MRYPLTIQAAIDKARLMVAQPEYVLSAEGTRELVAGLMAAIDSSSCFSRAVYRGAPTFVLVGWDRHAATLLWLWAAMRELDGEDPAVVHQARLDLVRFLDYAHSEGRKVYGLGQSVLTGCMELISTVNGLMVQARAAGTGEDPKNQATDIETLRRWLAETQFDMGGSPSALGEQAKAEVPA